MHVDSTLSLGITPVDSGIYFPKDKVWLGAHIEMERNRENVCLVLWAHTVKAQINSSNTGDDLML